MSNNTFSAPEKFNFADTASWVQWKRIFSQYRLITGLAKQPEENQVGALLYCMGGHANEIFDALKLSENDQKVFETVLTAFTNQFIAKRNYIFERAKLNSRVQKEDETIDQFATEIYALSGNCGLEKVTDVWAMLMCDRFVIGVKSKQLSEKLQLVEDLTFDKALVMARQYEQIKAQQPELQRNSEIKSEIKTEVDKVYTKGDQPKNKQYEKQDRPNNKQYERQDRGDRTGNNQTNRRRSLRQDETPRSYIIKTDTGTIQRNRYHLVKYGKTEEEEFEGDLEIEEQTGDEVIRGTEQITTTEIEQGIEEQPRDEASSEATYTTRKGRQIRPPKRLDL
uniref:Retrotransposon gag domain-containing protein n=1 Tax=Strigamia maritima TaxID=126957 RepID=T1J2T8_STRMM